MSIHEPPPFGPDKDPFVVDSGFTAYPYWGRNFKRIDGSQPIGRDKRSSVIDPGFEVGPDPYFGRDPSTIDATKKRFENGPLGPYRGYKLDRPEGDNAAPRKQRSLIYNPYDTTDKPPDIYP